MAIRPVLRPIGPSIAYVQLTQGQVSLIDLSDADECEKYNWHAAMQLTIKQFIACRGIWRKGQCNLRICLHAHLLNPPEGFEVDHKDRNSLNNHRFLNLRNATRAQNNANRDVKNRAGFKGIRPSGIGGRFEARFGAPPNRRSLGTFASAEEAYEAYKAEAIKVYGSFALQD